MKRSKTKKTASKPATLSGSRASSKSPKGTPTIVTKASVRSPKVTKTRAAQAARTAAPKAGTPTPILTKPQKRPLDLPPILLEGDEPHPPGMSGPGQRYTLAPLPSVAAPAPGAQATQLPESYGTKRLLLAARDPHWLYAHWDMTREQLDACSAQSGAGQLVLRIYRDALEGNPIQEVAVPPESRSWFAHVGMGATRFFAELGYYDPQRRWNAVSQSAGALTPPETVSEDASARFETLPSGPAFEELVKLVMAAVSGNVPLMEAIEQLRAAAFPGLPAPPSAAFAAAGAPGAETSAIYWTPQPWTPEQEQALAQIISMDAVRRGWLSSLEITELVRRQLVGEVSPPAAADFSPPTPAPAAGVTGAVSSISSPYGLGEARKGFWFNVNAELIIYGATEADAKVTIGGRKIRLRPDGSFSYRFALPDGQYELLVVATASDGSQGRSARLEVSRATEFRGEVGLHPQDPTLPPPLPDRIS